MLTYVNIDKNNVINVPLYLSFKDSELINIEEIDYVSIVNNDETEIIPSSILEINYLNELSLGEYSVVYVKDGDNRLIKGFLCQKIKKDL